MMDRFDETGWIAFAPDDDIAAWVQHAAPAAIDASMDVANRTAWMRHGGTWFVGVDALDNDQTGRVAGGPALAGAAIDWIRARYGNLPLHRGQVSVNYPGYPLQDPDESDANHRFRLNRDAAHVDGLLPVGPDKRRYLKEPHAYVLGIPLTFAGAAASPMVIWEGSHIIIADFFRAAFGETPESDISNTDMTAVYQDARRACFERCARKVVHVPLGGSYVLHRHALHGVAPWGAGAQADPAGRVIAYFRPECPGGGRDWLYSPV